MNKCTAKCTCSFNAGANDKVTSSPSSLLVAYTFLVPYFKRFHPPGHSRKHFYYSYNSSISTPTFIGHSMENKETRRRISDEGFMPRIRIICHRACYISKLRKPWHVPDEISRESSKSRFSFPQLGYFVRSSTCKSISSSAIKKTRARSPSRVRGNMCRTVIAIVDSTRSLCKGIRDSEEPWMEIVGAILRDRIK